jgi:hypothetical protein
MYPDLQQVRVDLMTLPPSFVVELGLDSEPSSTQAVRYGTLSTATRRYSQVLMCNLYLLENLINRAKINKNYFIIGLFSAIFRSVETTMPSTENSLRRQILSSYECFPWKWSLGGVEETFCK